ncbi:MAG: PEP-utilizing enzyme [Patescibacteria group bacterium]
MKFGNKYTSLINWLKQAGKTKAILSDSLADDNNKTKRLDLLNTILKLPTARAKYIEADKFNLHNPIIKNLIKELGSRTKKYSFRIAPQETIAGAFPVIKKYGLTFAQFEKYLKKLRLPKDKTTIRITDYRDTIKYAAIIIVSPDGIIGEVARGTLYHLTYAIPLKSADKITAFYQTPGGHLTLVSPTPELNTLAATVINYLYLKNNSVKQKLRRQGFRIYGNYLAGYYEYVEGADGDGVFTDMNLKKITTNINVKAVIKCLKKQAGKGNPLLRGLPVNPAPKIVTGNIQLINDQTINKFRAGNILLCKRTTVTYLPAMKRAKAIITELGGLTSHPAIIARELKIPCLVGIPGVTKKLRDKTQVQINMAEGTIKPTS